MDTKIIPNNENIQLIPTNPPDGDTEAYYVRRGIGTTNENSFYILRDVSSKFTLVFNSYNCASLKDKNNKTVEKNIPFNSSFLSCGIHKEEADKIMTLQQKILTENFGIPRSNRMIPNENSMLLIRESYYYMKFYVTPIGKKCDENDIIYPIVTTADKVSHQNMTIKDFITVINQLRQYPFSLMIIYDIYVLRSEELGIKFYPIPKEIKYININ